MTTFQEFITWLQRLDLYLGDDRLHPQLQAELPDINMEAIVNDVRFRLMATSENQRKEFLNFCKSMTYYDTADGRILDMTLSDGSGLGMQLKQILWAIWGGLKQLEQQFNLAAPVVTIPKNIAYLFKGDDGLAATFLQECQADPVPRNVAFRYKKLEMKGKAVDHYNNVKPLYTWLSENNGVNGKYTNFNKNF